MLLLPNQPCSADGELAESKSPVGEYREIEANLVGNHNARSRGQQDRLNGDIFDAAIRKTYSRARWIRHVLINGALVHEQAS